ncbi:hypothetical protein FVE85_0250 [Porphyridium purpureum]|uniref:Uncharacterized protein n=1 Tax=Porphyridium purpureum TaxID=35688 RepID=A0A5J4YY41_PORPP|nr:hypothetical protein FVE85_0250 [Porphyridium purpureum]|eukprot:POR5727..scf208_2
MSEPARDRRTRPVVAPSTLTVYTPPGVPNPPAAAHAQAAHVHWAQPSPRSIAPEAGPYAHEDGDENSFSFGTPPIIVGWKNLVFKLSLQRIINWPVLRLKLGANFNWGLDSQRRLIWRGIQPLGSVKEPFSGTQVQFTWNEVEFKKRYLLPGLSRHAFHFCAAMDYRTLSWKISCGIKPFSGAIESENANGTTFRHQQKITVHKDAYIKVKSRVVLPRISFDAEPGGYRVDSAGPLLVDLKEVAFKYSDNH